MKLLTSIVDLDSIQVKKLSFDLEQKATQIEALANAIIDLGGLLNAPVVQQINIDDYEIISGYLEYFAYLKAREINPSLPDRITVFVADTKNQIAVHHQLEILQSIENTQQYLSHSTESSKSEIDLQIKNLEHSIKNNNRLVFTALEKNKAEILAAIEAKLPQPIPPMEAFNRILEPEIASQVQRKLEFLGDSKAKKVVARLQEISRKENHQPFRSFNEISELLKEQQKNRLVRLLSQDSMLKVIDRWND